MSEMLAGPMEAIKKHPVAIGGAAIVLVLLFMRGGSNSGSAASSGLAAGLQAQQLQDQTQIALTQASAQQSTANAAIAGDIQKATIAAGVQTNQSLLAATMGVLSQAGNNFAVQQQTATTLDANNKSATIAAMQIGAASSAHTQDVNAQLAAYGQSIGLQTKALDFTQANLPTLIQFNEQTQQANNNTALDMAKIGQQTTLQIAPIWADVQKYISGQNASVGIAQANSAVNVAKVNSDTATNVAGINAASNVASSALGGGGLLSSIGSLFGF